MDLAPLRQSIHNLQAVSLALDYEKFKAEKELVEVVQKWKKAGSKLKKLKHKLRRAYCKLQKKLGHPCKSHELEHHRHPGSKVGRIGRFPAWQEEQGLDLEMLYGVALQAGFDRPLRGCKKAGVPRLPIFELGKAVKRVRAVNKKLIAFERGFISEDGIPEREWFKHLGVAPGKWLGESRLHFYVVRFAADGDVICRVWSYDVACVDGGDYD